MNIDKSYLRDVERECDERAADVGIVRARADSRAAQARAIECLDRHQPAIGGMVARNTAGYAHTYERMTGELPPENAEPTRAGLLDLLQRILAALLFILAVLFGSVQIYSSSNLTEVAAATLGTAMALAITLIVYTFGKLVVVKHPREPRFALAKIERWQRQTALALLLALALFLGDGFTTAALDGSTILLKLSVAILVIATPLLTGLLLASADVRAWSVPFVRVHRRVTRLSQAMAALRAKCQPAETPRAENTGAADNAEHDAPHAATPPEQPVHEQPAAEAPAPAAPTNGRARAASAAAVMVAFAIAFGSSGARAPLHAQEAPPAKSLALEYGELWVDDSGSPRADVLASRIEQFFELAPALAERGLHTWQIYRFYGHAFEANQVFTLKLPAFAPPLCEPLVYSEAAKWFTHVQKQERAAWEKKCHDMNKAEREKFDRGRDTDLRNAKASLADEKLKPTGSCTALRELLTRVSMQPVTRRRTVVILSDGREWCQRDRRDPLPRPEGPVEVVLVSIPAGGTSVPDVEQFDACRKYWQRAAPWMRVVAGNSFDGSLFKTSNE